MVAQEHVLRALVNALDQQRLHHAYLFTGTRGVGKTTIARIFAKCLNCLEGVSSNPCGQCDACLAVDEGRFIDLLEVDAASRTKVEDTRELLENVQYAPTRGRYKVYLIDEVHMLSSHSFNALLKTLEEPPPHVKFLLATTDPQKLPVTILSRCLQFSLKALPAQRIVQHIQHILQQENIANEEAALWHIARAANGSMRDALSLTDQAIAFGGGNNVGEQDVQTMLGSIDRNLVVKLLQCLLEQNAAALLQAANNMVDQGAESSEILDDLIGLIHRIAVAQVVPESEDNSEGDSEKILTLAQQISAEDVQLYYQIALIGRRDLALAPEPRNGLEMVLLRMLTFRPTNLEPITGGGSNTGAKAGVQAARTGAAKASSAGGPANVAATNNATATHAVDTNAADASATNSKTTISKTTNSKTTNANTASSPRQQLRETMAAASIIGDSKKSQSSPVAKANPQNSPTQGAQPQDRPLIGKSSKVAVEARSVNEPSVNGQAKPSPQPGAMKEANVTHVSEEIAQGQDGSGHWQPATAQPPPAQHGEQSPPASPGSGKILNFPSNNVSVPEDEGALLHSGAANSSLRHGDNGKETPLTEKIDPLDLDWRLLVEQLQIKGGALNLARNCALENQDQYQLLLVLNPKHEAIYRPQHIEVLEQALLAYFDKSYRLQLEIRDSVVQTPAEQIEADQAARLARATTHLENDPVVKNLVLQMDASIDHSSIKPID